MATKSAGIDPAHVRSVDFRCIRRFETAFREFLVRIHQFLCLQDNFGVLVHDPLSGATAAIDAPEEGPIREALEATGWQLSHILVTHSHHDHIAAVAPLKRRFGCRVVAPARAAAELPDADLYVAEGDSVEVGDLTAKVMELPGHCADHVGYHFDRQQVLFAGDVLFALGCGRVFGDAYDAMWRSLSRIAALPPETSVYFGHEYTLGNAKFALSVDPDNPDLKGQAKRVETVRARGDFTSPTTVAAERAANPFLRAGLPALAAGVGMAGQSPARVFRELRERKNRF